MGNFGACTGSIQVNDAPALAGALTWNFGTVLEPGMLRAAQKRTAAAGLLPDLYAPLKREVSATVHYLLYGGAGRTQSLTRATSASECCAHGQGQLLQGLLNKYQPAGPGRHMPQGLMRSCQLPNTPNTSQ